MKFLKYILFSALLFIGSVGFSQNLIQPAPLIRWNMVFDGVDEYFNINNTLTNVLSTTTQGTWSFWIKPVDATPASALLPLAFGDTDANEFIVIQLDGTSTGKVSLQINKEGVSQFFLRTDNAVLSDNTWSHIAITQPGAGSAAAIYIDAVLVPQTLTSGADDDAWFNNLSGLDNGRIGDLNFNSGGEQFHFCGNIDEVSIWNDALSQPEIAEIYENNHPTNLRTHGKYANLAFWGQMGEFSNYIGGVWNIVDASVNDNTAVSVNMDLTDKILTDLVYEQPTGLIKVGTSLMQSP